jgi:AcrR family transcriptional regulator
VSAEPSLRERKKQQTRQLIADKARRLFDDRGFEQVTVAEIARAADVSEGTVFNYFPTKEDLVYGHMEVFEASLLEAIRDREPGESVLSAFGRFFAERYGRIATEEGAEVTLQAARIISGSPALQAREREILARYTQSLAALIAEETGVRADDIEPSVAANALIGLHRALLDYTRRQVLAGRRGRSLATDVKAQTERALARLERGLRDYAIKV